ncbi:YafY family protein [Paenibacillus sp. KS-LC4]|uniref:helix-turn-helix transcriptional regulator n=1 Tax=Paenibacillus sp. KS-LC4 TaxID=2979727 RepID=UPI0030D26A78
MNKAQRLIQLIMLVNERKQFTIQELSEELGVSRRTMIRDLMELSELGVPLYSQVGPGGGYRILREKLLPPISFTENEATALFFACQSLQNYKSLPFENEVNAALQKFMHYLSSEPKQKIERMQQRLVFWVPPHQMEIPFLQPLLEAALDQQVITIVYEAATRRERMIQPIGLYTMNGLWYCQAYCFLAEGNRVFRVDRVKALAPQEDQSMQLEKTEAHIRPWIMRMEESDLLQLEVDLTAEGVRRCQSELWLSQAVMLHEDGSGTIHTKLSASYISWAVQFFLGFGTEANVRQPPQLRAAIGDKLKQLMQQYAH